MNTDLSPLLHPRSVAIIGASRDPTKRGHQVVRALQEAGYPGDIYLVHPDGGELLGLPVSPAIGELDAVPDLALICTAAVRVPDVVRACADRGIPGAIVLAVGFREAGEQGRELENTILSLAATSGLRLIGPNTSGLLNPALGLNLVGAPPPRAGSLAVLSQSGNVGLDIMTQLRDRELGLSLYVGVGNEGDVRFDEYLEFLERDEATRAILVYAEGPSDPKAFFATAERVNRTKPIVVLKGGRSERGNSAALSHTGAIAGSYDVFAALLRQRGITITTRSDQVLDLALALGGQPPGAHGLQHGVAVIADGGGHATLAVDRLADLGMELAEFSPEGQEQLRELLGPAAAVGNPVDLAGAGDRNMSVFAECMDVVAAESAVGSVLLTGLFGGYTIRFDDSLDQEETEAAVRITRIAAETAVPVLVHTLYASHKTDALLQLRKAGIPVLASLDTAGRCIQALFARGESLAADQETDGGRPPDPEAPGRAAKPGVEASLMVEQARREGRVALTEAEGRRIVAEAGVPLVPGDLCMSPSEAVAAAGSFEGPAVAKLISSTILHRSEAGGVALGLRTSVEVEDAFERIQASAAAFAQEAGIEADFRGVLICEQLSEPIAELLVGCRRDPQYGPILVVGAGGVSAEVWPDRSIRGLPLAADEVQEMLAELRIFPILRGYRGRPPVDFESLTSLIQSLAVYFLANRGLAEVELNPVFTAPGHAVAVDVLAAVTDLSSVPAPPLGSTGAS